MHLVIGNDHRGFAIKPLVIRVITNLGHSYEDFGCHDTEPVDYPDIARKAAEAVADGNFEAGILMCGTGIGMSVTANKVKGIRAALCHNAFTSYRARRHNDANILCFGAEEGRVMVPAIVEKFLATEFEGGRHLDRLNKIKAIENGWTGSI